jgi:hypothetical protein
MNDTMQTFKSQIAVPALFITAAAFLGVMSVSYGYAAQGADDFTSAGVKLRADGTVDDTQAAREQMAASSSAGIKLRGDGTVDDTQPGAMAAAPSAEKLRGDGTADDRTRSGEDRTSAGRADRSAQVERSGHAERVERVERPQRVERVERPERVERVQRIERPERVERTDRTSR